MKHIGLFEGIGGFSLAARWIGWETVAWCEWNEFGQKVLKHHFPEAEGHGDITKTDFTKYANKIDILTGGFPCQPYSLAGKRKGKEDERHLWPEMLRAIREIQPSWVVGENVFGLVNWSGGLVFHEVQTDLEAQGYEVFPYVLPACAVKAPHRRDRVWFVAYSNSNGQCRSNCQHEINTSKGGLNSFGDTESLHTEQSIIKHAYGIGQERRLHEVKPEITIGEQFSERNARNIKPTGWDNFPTEPPICGGDDGLPTELDGITFSKWRGESIKAYGNAIVPQVALQIFKAIEEYNKLNP